MKRRVWLSVIGLCMGAAARADDSNFRLYLIGGRAAGMGGAYTGISDDGSGGYYNPGGLAFSRRSSISMTASVYGIETGTLSNALYGQDFSYSDLNLVPVMTSFVLKFGPNDVDTGVPNNTLLLSIYVPESLNNDDRRSIILPQNAFFLTQKEQTIWLGGGYALRLGPVGLGASVYGLIGSSTAQLAFNIVNPTTPSQFAVLSYRTDISGLGAVGALGVRLDATDELSFGLSAYSPAVGSGKRHVFLQVAFASSTTPPAAAAVDRDHLDATWSLPLRVQFGAAWHRDPWTIAADLILLGPRDVTDNPELESQGFSRHVVRQTVVNGSFGGEYLIGASFPLRLGVFTDFAASKTPNADNHVDNDSHVNRYGLSFSIGYLGEHVHTNVGVIGSYGQGRALVPDQNFDFTHLVPADVKQLSAYFFLSTTYGF